MDRVTGAIDDEKDAIRRAVRASRLARPDAERTAAADAIAQRGSALVARAGAATVACYLSSPDEPPTRALIAALQREGIRVLLPMIRPGRVLDWGEHAGEERRTRLGVPETVADPLGPSAIREAGLVFAPAAAVDLDGRRLGWGGGYYDRALALLPSRRPVWAVLYDSDVVDRVPHEAHDLPVAGAVTPTRTLSFDR